MRDIMSDQEVNEIADTPAGTTIDVTHRLENRSGSSSGQTKEGEKSDYQRAAEDAVSQAPVPSRTVEELTQEIKGVGQSIATIRDGKVEIEKLRQSNANKA